MKPKKLIVELLDYVELFEKSVQHPDELEIDSFITFVNSMRAKRSPELNVKEKFERDLSDAGIAKDLSMLHRYSRIYIKKALASSKHLQTEDEYTFLVSLLAENGLSKTELNNRNCTEKTSGSEVIRRLKNHGLVEEQPDPNDKRSVRVLITPAGRAELQAIFPMIRLSANTLSAPLLPEQKEVLRHILRNMCSAHSLLFTHRNEMTLEEMFDYLYGCRPEPD